MSSTPHLKSLNFHKHCSLSPPSPSNSLQPTTYLQIHKNHVFNKKKGPKKKNNYFIETEFANSTLSNKVTLKAIKKKFLVDNPIHSRKQFHCHMRDDSFVVYQCLMHKNKLMGIRKRKEINQNCNFIWLTPSTRKQ